MRALSGRQFPLDCWFVFAGRLVSLIQPASKNVQDFSYNTTPPPRSTASSQSTYLTVCWVSLFLLLPAPLLAKMCTTTCEIRQVKNKWWTCLYGAVCPHPACTKGRTVSLKLRLFLLALWPHGLMGVTLRSQGMSDRTLPKFSFFLIQADTLNIL